MVKMKKCDVCETEFDANLRNHGKGTQRYCSQKCRQVADNRRHYRRHNPPKSEDELKRACVICGVQFLTDKFHPNALTCSVKCNEARMNAARRRDTSERVDESKRECAECGNVFTPNKLALGTAKFCSAECASRDHSRRGAQTRQAGHNKRLKTKIWKDAKKLALERDGNKCCVCGDAERVHVHHKFHVTEAEMNDHSLNNLISLCGACHHTMHDIKIGRDGDGFVISGAVFELFGIKSVRIV